MGFARYGRISKVQSIVQRGEWDCVRFLAVTNVEVVKTKDRMSLEAVWGKMFESERGSGPRPDGHVLGSHASQGIILDTGSMEETLQGNDTI